MTCKQSILFIALTLWRKCEHQYFSCHETENDGSYSKWCDAFCRYLHHFPAPNICGYAWFVELIYILCTNVWNSFRNWNSIWITIYYIIWKINKHTHGLESICWWNMWTKTFFIFIFVDFAGQPTFYLWILCNKLHLYYLADTQSSCATSFMDITHIYEIQLNIYLWILQKTGQIYDPTVCHCVFPASRTFLNSFYTLGKYQCISII